MQIFRWASTEVFHSVKKKDTWKKEMNWTHQNGLAHLQKQLQKQKETSSLILLWHGSISITCKLVPTTCSILCVDGVYATTKKLRKNKVPSCHVLAEKLIGEWSQRDLGASETKNLGDQLETVLATRILL